MTQIGHRRPSSVVSHFATDQKVEGDFMSEPQRCYAELVSAFLVSQEDKQI